MGLLVTGGLMESLPIVSCVPTVLLGKSSAARAAGYIDRCAAPLAGLVFFVQLPVGHRLEEGVRRGDFPGCQCLGLF